MVVLEAGRILGTQVGSAAPLFLAVLAVHVPAGMAAVVTGAGAALSRKGGRRHMRMGRWYYAAITVVFATAAVLAALRWREDWDLFVLGALAYACATLGYLNRRRRGGDGVHIAAMGVSYALMLTAFYVDNGPHLPVWDRLPTLVFWLLPGTVAAPLILRAVRRTGARRPRGPRPARRRRACGAQVAR